MCRYQWGLRMQDEIVQAIVTKRLVSFGYQGHQRVIEPHVIGVKGGVTQVLGYQVGGTSKSGGLPQWRRFDLPLIQAMKMTGESFPGPRDYPSGIHSSWDIIIAVVD